MDKVLFIWCNILGAIGMLLFFITSFLKNKKMVLSIQSIGHVFLAITEFLSKTYSTIVQEFLCWLRDLGIVTGIAKKIFKIVVLILILVVGVTFNIIFDNCSIYGFIVILANLIFTIDVFYNNQSIFWFKIVSAISNLSWMALFINSQVYTSAIVNGISSVINITLAIILLIGYKKGKIDRMGKRIKKPEEMNDESNV